MIFNWFRNSKDSDFDELDQKIAAADARIAAKEEILKNLQESVERKTAEVEVLKETVNRYQNTLKRGKN